jgi:RND superfamily putative drug exporter
VLARLARSVVRRRIRVLIGTLVFVVAAGAVGGGVAKRLSSGGFDDPHSQSSQVQRLVAREFPQGSTPNMILLITAKNGNVDSAAVADEGRRLTEELASQPSIGGAAFSYWSLDGATPLRSKAGDQALVLAKISGGDDAVRKQIDTLSPAFTRDDSVMSVRVGGYAEVFRQVGTTIKKDLARAEMIALPITLVLLVLVFGSVVAASLPLGVGLLAIMGTFLVLQLFTMVTQVSVYALNMTTAMGLGLAIDYSLFIVSRYREELRHGLEPDDAVVRTVTTAGRTVLFSALTVAVSLVALIVFPLSFLRSFAYAGVAVVALAAAGSVVVLPALLAVLGRRVDSLTLFRRRGDSEPGHGFWHRVAMNVMRRPVIVGGGVVIVLLLLGAPFLNIHFGLPDDRVLPSSVSSRTVQDQIRRNFTSEEAGAVIVIAQGVDGRSRAADVDAYATTLSTVAGVARVDGATGSYAGGRKVPAPADPRLVARFTSPAGSMLSVVPSVEPNSAAGERLVKDIRHLSPPFAVKVGGPSAQLVDSKASLFGRMPLAGLLIALVTFTVLFLFTGSVVVPVKAVVLNLLSLTATFGAMVWIFQEGHLAGFLHFTPTGTIDTTTPILMFCIAFGLSMDYEVFLLSRIKEEHDRTGDNVSSVAIGLEHTGRIVTAAAALLGVVFISFATSGVTFIKLFGIGLTMAVVMDATLVRGLLVPSFMRLAGDANWWAPKWMRRLYDRVGLSESDSGTTPRVMSITGTPASDLADGSQRDVVDAGRRS